MQFRIEQPDWSYLRGALSFLIAAGALGLALLAGSVWYARTMERQQLEHEQARRAAEQRYLTLDQQAQLIKDYLSPFIGLYATGLLGREQRLRWVEVLQETGAKLQLAALDYEIAAQRPYTAKLPPGEGGYGVFVSEMRLDMQLLHEGDLVALLAALEQRGKGLYTAPECTLERNFTRLTDNLQAGNLSGSCLLHWFSLRRTGNAAQEVGYPQGPAGDATAADVVPGTSPGRAEDRLGRLFTTPEQRRYFKQGRQAAAGRGSPGILPAGIVARQWSAPAAPGVRPRASSGSGAAATTFKGLIYRQDGTRLTLFNEGGAGAPNRP